MSSYYKQSGGGWSWGEVPGLASDNGDKVSGDPMGGAPEAGTEEDPIRYINSLSVVDGIAQFARNLNPSLRDYRKIEAFINKEVGTGTPEERKQRLMELVRSYYSFFQFKYKLARIHQGLGLSGAGKKKKPKGSKKKGPPKKGPPKKGHSKKGHSKKGPKKKWGTQGGGKSRKPKKAKQTRRKPKRSRLSRRSRLAGYNPYPNE